MLADPSRRRQKMCRHHPPNDVIISEHSVGLSFRRLSQDESLPRVSSPRDGHVPRDGLVGCHAASRAGRQEGHRQGHCPSPGSLTHGPDCDGAQHEQPSRTSEQGERALLSVRSAERRHTGCSFTASCSFTPPSAPDHTQPPLLQLKYLVDVELAEDRAVRLAKEAARASVKPPLVVDHH